MKANFIILHLESNYEIIFSTIKGFFTSRSLSYTFSIQSAVWISSLSQIYGKDYFVILLSMCVEFDLNIFRYLPIDEIGQKTRVPSEWFLPERWWNCVHSTCEILRTEMTPRNRSIPENIGRWYESIRERKRQHSVCNVCINTKYIFFFNCKNNNFFLPYLSVFFVLTILVSWDTFSFKLMKHLKLYWYCLSKLWFVELVSSKFIFLNQHSY